MIEGVAAGEIGEFAVREWLATRVRSGEVRTYRSGE
jgi:hypothetical protein